MNRVTTAAVAVLLVGAMGGISLAQSTDTGNAAPPPKPPAPSGDTSAQAYPGMMGPWHRPGGWNRFGGMHGGMGGNFLAQACGDRGAEALEIAFIRIKYAVKPDSTQAPLLQALRDAALADQKTFAEACTSAMQQDNRGGQQSILDLLDLHQKLVNAHAAALNDVMPKFKAFYDSLNDSQKTTLDQAFRAHFAMGMQGRQGMRGWRGMQGQRNWQGMQAPHRWGNEGRRGWGMHWQGPQGWSWQRPGGPDMSGTDQNGTDQGSQNQGGQNQGGQDDMTAPNPSGTDQNAQPPSPPASDTQDYTHS